MSTINSGGEEKTATDLRKYLGTAVGAANAVHVQPGTAAVFPVSDNGGSLTVDAPVGTPVFVQLSDGAAAITTLPVSLASVPSHAVTVAAGGIASGALVDGSLVTIGALADAKDSATDTTPVSVISLLKQISYEAQNPSAQVVSINAGGFATGAASYAKTEDSASANADAGVACMAVRKATPANTSGADGDYEMLQMANGRLWATAQMQDGAGNAVESATTDPVGTERGLIVRNIPSGTQAISGTLFVTTPSNRPSLMNTLDMTSTSSLFDLLYDSALMGVGTATITIRGTWTGTITITGLADGAGTYVAIPAIVPSTGAVVTSFTANGTWVVPVAGYGDVQFKCSVAGSGTATVDWMASIGCQAAHALQAGSWTVTATDGGGSLTVDGTVAVTDGGGSLTVDGTVAATQSGTWTVQPGNTANTTAWLVTGTGGTFPVTDSGGSLTVDAPVGTPVFVRLSDGAAAITTLPVSLASVPSHAVTNAGTFAVQAAQSGTWDIATVTTVTTVSAVTDASVQGKAAEDAALSGNPVRQGVRASAAEPTAMSADNDVVTPWADRRGRAVVKQQCGTATLANVTGSASSVTILAANTSRLGATIWNDSSALLYLKFGTTASTTDCTIKMAADSYYEVPFGYSGRIDGIWASATGAARVTELT